GVRSRSRASFLVLDMLGQVLLTTPLPAGKLALDLDLTPLDAGQYILKLQSARGVTSQNITVR
ncbi:MAG: T9SS type A sorting domain-containing protein, partial [Hymenobacter sp.]